MRLSKVLGPLTISDTSKLIKSICLRLKVRSNMADNESAASATIESQSKLWGGRFREGVDPIMERFNRSIDYDQIMWHADITGSIAYARGLLRIGLLQQEEATQICEGLEQVKAEWQTGVFAVKVSKECDCEGY